MVIRTRKWMLYLGMLAVVSFVLMDFLGSILWTGYSPISQYVSELFSAQSPHLHLARLFLNVYTICFCLFCLAMSVQAARAYHWCCKAGFLLLFLLGFASVLGYGTVPIGMNFIFVANDIFHLVFTISLLCCAVLALILVSYGYLKQERYKRLGRISSIAALLFILFNLLHLTAILAGWNVLGLMQRLSFYSFHLFIFMLSFLYIRRRLQSSWDAE